jgi:hypothetical protein
VDLEYFVLLKNRPACAFQRNPLHSEEQHLSNIQDLMGINDITPARDGFTNIAERLPALEQSLRAKREKLFAIVELMNNLIESAQRSERDTSAAVHNIRSWPAERLFRCVNAISGEITEISVYELGHGGVLRNLDVWINRAKRVASTEYDKYLQRFIEETRIPAEETVESFNAKLKKRKNRKLLFPDRQFNCPVFGQGKLCPNCSFSRCDKCCFKEESCDECILKSEKFEASNLLDVLTGGKPCTPENKLDLYFTNQTARSNFYGGRVMGGRGNTRSPELPKVVACSNTVYFKAHGEQYKEANRYDRSMNNMRFSLDNIRGCIQHALLTLLLYQRPTDFEEQAIWRT